MSAGADPWGRYWAGGGTARGERGCLPNRGGPLATACRSLWQDFARKLAKGAQLLDLATGSGDVPIAIAEARRDLRLIGIDSARTLPAAPKGVKLKGGVAMEDLPFPDGRFDAVTSQFGYEYGDTARIAAESARVARSGAQLLLLVHHRSSPILSHNLARREALLWGLQTDGFLQQAKRFAATGMRAGLPTPPPFLSAPEHARRLFPSQSAAAELMTGMNQRLEIGRRAPGEALRLLEELEQEARGESERLRLLDSAARDETQIEAIAKELAEAGWRVPETSTLAELGAPAPLAWIVRARR